MPRIYPVRLAIALIALLGLAACQSSDERAEGHYQSALELMAEGDQERALVELRNVFDLNGSHREARGLYAATLIELGRNPEAYGQYLRLVEQYPDDVPALLALSRIAMARQDWTELRRHGGTARELAPDDPEVRSIGVNIDYSTALEESDAPARREVVRQAEALSAERPDDLQLRRVLVDGALRDNDMELALSRVDDALAVAPEERSLYDTKLSLLVQLDRISELEDLLLAMVERFPEDTEIVANLIRYYLSRDETDAAEAFLRTRAADPAPEEATAHETDLVVFLLEQRGPAAALEELDRAIAASDDNSMFRSLRARIRFDQGETAEAIAEMESLLEGADDGIEANSDRIVLARMLEATGNLVGAQRLVGEVLETDATQVEAIKLRARWQIESDDADQAVSLLRTALDASPQDVEAMSLMAQAHLRNGNRDLARDLLSLAVQASNSGPEETLAYVELLVQDDRLQLAEEVLIDALRVAPSNLRLLIELGGLYIRMEDWTRVQQVESQLRRDERPVAARAADGLQASRLASEGRTDEAVSFLEDLAEENTGDLSAQIAVVRARLINGDAEGAVAFAGELAAAQPDNIALRFVNATTLAATGDRDGAETAYRDILATDDQIEDAWIGLVRTLYSKGELEQATTALDEGLAAMPEAMNLLWAEASFLERSGDREGALEIYEALYERAPESTVVVNNFASLLSTLRDDPESLERAYAIARRLRDTQTPAFRDTYGWIAYRRGDHETAVEYLEPAAEALADDPLVQYHLGMTYQALDRPGDALTQFRRAVELAGDDARPQFEEARAEIAALEAQGTTPDSTATPDPATAPADGEASDGTVPDDAPTQDGTADR